MELQNWLASFHGDEAVRCHAIQAFIPVLLLLVNGSDRKQEFKCFCLGSCIGIEKTAVYIIWFCLECYFGFLTECQHFWLNKTMRFSLRQLAWNIYWLNCSIFWSISTSTFSIYSPDGISANHSLSFTFMASYFKWQINHCLLNSKGKKNAITINCTQFPFRMNKWEYAESFDIFRSINIIRVVLNCINSRHLSQNIQFEFAKHTVLTGSYQLLSASVKKWFSSSFCYLLTSVFVFGSSETSPLDRTDNVDGKIVGGFATKIDKIPWQVSLRYFGEHHCGDSIIADQWILKAAHCSA